MDWLRGVKSLFDEELVRLEKALEIAREAQRMAPTPQESHSNTMMSEMEKLVTALEMDIAKHKEYMAKIPKEYLPDTGTLGEWNMYAEVEVKGQKLKVVLVPEGMGGKKVGEVILVSVGSPLGKTLV